VERGVWIDKVLAELTLPEKVSLLSGADAWTTTAVESAGIPPVTVTDGPIGARGAGGRGLTSACFPSATALGATWDPALLGEVGAALADEARSKRAQVLLGPTVNLHRTPLAGRNFECYSEDPHLTAELAVAFIRGLQDAGVGACVKHFVANDSEFERMTISSEVDERTLRELYLLPFERAVAEAGAWAVMGAYNRVNGTYACAHRELLVDLLKEEWRFDGVVVSDWGAVHDTEETANGGTDLEMPGPARHFGDRLVAAVRAGAVDEAVVDDKVRRVLRLVTRAGVLDRPPADEATAQDRPEHRALTRRAATDAMVLLRNDPVPEGGPALPLDAGVRSLAVIGPNAARAAIQGGGSATVQPHPVVHPLAAIEGRAAAAGVTVVHEPGAVNDRYVPEPDRAWFEPLDEDGYGLLVEYFDGDEPAGEPVSSRRVPGASHIWWREPPGVTAPERFAARWTGRLRPPTSGPWRFGVAAVGRARLFVDGVEIVDNWSDPVPGEVLFGRGSAEVVGVAHLDAGRAHDVRIEMARAPEPGPTALRVGMAPHVDGAGLDRAVRAAASADAAVVIVGTTTEWESEGFDRPSMALPGGQDELVRRVAAVNPRTVVVVNAGSPVEMPWADDVAAIVALWFGGQEQGPALAGVLFGDAEPGGRLPTTFPRHYRDHPALFGYPGESGRVRYGEGVFVGYRGYLARGSEPRFPFGHGLSYTTFEHAGLRVELVGDDPVARAHVVVANTGDRRGAEVVQLFVGPPPGPLARPPLELKAFAKVVLAPGERRTVTLDLGPRAFTAFDPLVPGWRSEPGTHRVVVASSGRPVAEAALDLPRALVLPVR
jgi:beta-glucosidase